MITIGSRWKSTDYKDFVVEGVEKKDNQIWVYYTNGEQKFSCLEPAFRVRFSPCVE